MSIESIIYRTRIPDRIRKKITRTSSCWIWTGLVNRDGYGRTYWKGSMKLAHRVIYEIYFGEIPEGLTIDHLCSVRNYVRPSHLEAVTQQENLSRGTSPNTLNKLKTYCMRGHPFDKENTYYRKDGSGRHCRRCDADKHREARVR